MRTRNNSTKRPGTSPAFFQSLNPVTPTTVKKNPLAQLMTIISFLLKNGAILVAILEILKHAQETLKPHLPSQNVSLEK
jgi:hypothetical protein